MDHSTIVIVIRSILLMGNCTIVKANFIIVMKSTFLILWIFAPVHLRFGTVALLQVVEPHGQVLGLLPQVGLHSVSPLLHLAKEYFAKQ